MERRRKNSHDLEHRASFCRRRCLPSRPVLFMLSACGLLLLSAWLLYQGAPADTTAVSPVSVPGDNIPPRYAESAENLDFRIKDSRRILESVRAELSEMEEKRRQLLEDNKDLNGTKKELELEVTRKRQTLDSLNSQLQLVQAALNDQRELAAPPLRLPSRLSSPLSDATFNPLPASPHRPCSLSSCFDHSRCSLFTGFTVTSDDLGSEWPREGLAGPINGQRPCLRLRSEAAGASVNDLVLSTDESASDPASPAMFASSRFPPGAFRHGFDVVIPPIIDQKATRDAIWSSLPPLLPLHRRLFISFEGDPAFDGTESLQRQLDASLGTKEQPARMLWACENGKEDLPPGTSWALCKGREELLSTSTFVLIPGGKDVLFAGSRATDPRTLRRVSEALRHGAVPVILGPSLLLPFAETLDWRRVAVFAHPARVTELHTLLASISPEDLAEYKRAGRAVYENYLCCPDTVLAATLALVRQRLGMPGPLEPDEQGGKVMADWSPPEDARIELPSMTDPEEHLGPLQLPYASPSFVHNATLSGLYSYSLWNDHYQPFKHRPFFPFRIPLPSEVQFTTKDDLGFRPIGGGAGGSGREFSASLGGNFPREQFTVVIQTYERNDVLVSTIQRLNDLPYLNKVIVVWNSPDPPDASMLWPALSAPLEVVRGNGNSLNNRFLPFTHIQTEAVLSIDDDVHLTQAEMILAFRTWRENRDRIVGFPGRFHAWDGGGWRYNSNHSCQLSMVLTGAAFIHNWYLYEYSRVMPSVIRQRVEELINCEDLAMNALVSHITRKPPIKVTSKWTFRCPGCPETLSADESHFQERHECLRLITRIFGYNPLLYTQYRVDSVLFKTRIPHQHQKCFKFI